MTGLRALVEAVRSARADHDDYEAPAVERTQYALCSYLLDTPDVLAAVEAHPDAMEALAAVRRLGEAMREYRRVRGREHVERFAARTEVDDANDAVYALADRLAAREEG